MNLAPPQRLRVDRRWCFPAVGLAAWLALLAFVVPYDPDEAIYKIIVTDMVDGHWPYEHLFINRQPLLFLAYLPAGFGASIEVQRLVAAAALLASVPAFFTLARRLLSERQATFALLSYCVLLANPYMITGANVEAFLLLPLIAAAVVPSAVLAGVLLGIALMLKLTVLPLVPAILALRAQRPWVALLAMAGACALCSLPFIPVWGDFWEANVTFNFAYAEHSSSNRLANVFAVHWGVLLPALPVWIAAAIGVARERRLVVWLLILSSFLAMRSTGLNFGHYYALLAPAAALLAGVGLEYLTRHTRRAVWVLVPSTVIGVTVLAAGLLAYALLDDPSYEEVVREIDHHPGELYVLGGHSEIYAYTDRQPLRRYFFSPPMVFNEHWGDETRADLLACAPDVMLIPERNEFQVGWADEIGDVYALRKDFDFGVLYAEPFIDCER
jgi:4-amino-4-deoxy-L-arabinose transferase-like glycosyltransferase